MKIGGHVLSVNVEKHEIAPIHDYEELKDLGGPGCAYSLKFQQIASQFSRTTTLKTKQGSSAHKKFLDTSMNMNSSFNAPNASTRTSEFHSVMNLTNRRVNPFASSGFFASVEDRVRSPPFNFKNTSRMNVFSSQESKRSTGIGSVKQSERASKKEATSDGQKA